MISCSPSSTPGMCNFLIALICSAAQPARPLPPAPASCPCQVAVSSDLNGPQLIEVDRPPRPRCPARSPRAPGASTAQQASSPSSDDAFERRSMAAYGGPVGGAGIRPCPPPPRGFPDIRVVRRALALSVRVKIEEQHRVAAPVQEARAPDHRPARRAIRAGAPRLRRAWRRERTSRAAGRRCRSGTRPRAPAGRAAADRRGDGQPPPSGRRTRARRPRPPTRPRARRHRARSPSAEHGKRRRASALALTHRGRRAPWRHRARAGADPRRGPSPAPGSGVPEGRPSR